jgi:hypothetical protein
MSIQAVLSRIDMIAAAQQQLASPVGSSGAANASAIGATLNGTSAAGASSATSFASTLAQAQGTSASNASGVAGTTTGVTGTATGVTGVTGVPTSDATSTGAVVPGAVVAQAAWNPQQKPIAGWIVPVLDWASQHGWSGSVTSGYRSYSQQSQINASGAFSAPAGKSNHETTVYPGGAVDVSDPSQLIQVLKGYTGPYKLVGGVLGAVDPEHFSANGH